jgi:hypothetical protein
MQIMSSQLCKTEIAPSLDFALRSDINLVYSGTFQIVWNQLADEIIKSPIALAHNLPIVQALNKRLFEKDDISANDYLAMAGFGRDGIVEKIKQNLRDRFNREPGFNIQMVLPDDILTYAYLEKSIPFETNFDVFDEPFSFSDNTRVQSFGVIKGDAAADQVQILDYSHADDFILKFSSPMFAQWKAQREGVKYAPKITDEIILAKVTPGPTLLATVEHVMERIKASKYSKQILDSNVPEILQIPKIDFDILHQYSEIEGLPFLNPNFQQYRIAQALQAIKFRLDETGAKLSSEGFMHLHLGASEQIRKFIFDKPFLLYFREEQSRYPYLALWIGNSEILVKA